MLNDLFDFEAKLSVDEGEDEIREDQNAHFIEGKAVHTFNELSAILEYMPAGHEHDEEHPAKEIEDHGDDDLPELDKEEEEKLKNDESLKWDEDDEEPGEDDEEKDPDDEKAEEKDSEEEEPEEKPRRRTKKKG
jgi:hypothetical protein